MDLIIHIVKHLGKKIFPTSGSPEVLFVVYLTVIVVCRDQCVVISMGDFKNIHTWLSWVSLQGLLCLNIVAPT